MGSALPTTETKWAECGQSAGVVVYERGSADFVLFEVCGSCSGIGDKPQIFQRQETLCHTAIGFRG